MPFKRILLGTVVTFLVLFVVGYLLWSVIFAATWENMTDAPQTANPDMLLLTISFLLIAFAMAYIYPFGYEGGAPVMEGLRFGVITWFLVSLAVGVGYLAFTPDNFGAVVFSQFLNLIQYACAGIALGLVMGHMGTGLPVAEPETVEAEPEPGMEEPPLTGEVAGEE